eukprot:jgi/Mesvir1/22382/Mv17874-RA.1
MGESEFWGLHDSKRDQAHDSTTVQLKAAHSTFACRRQQVDVPATACLFVAGACKQLQSYNCNVNRNKCRRFLLEGMQECAHFVMIRRWCCDISALPTKQKLAWHRGQLARRLCTQTTIFKPEIRRRRYELADSWPVSYGQWYSMPAQADQPTQPVGQGMSQGPSREAAMEAEIVHLARQLARQLDFWRKQAELSHTNGDQERRQWQDRAVVAEHAFAEKEAQLGLCQAHVAELERQLEDVKAMLVEGERQLAEARGVLEEVTASKEEASQSLSHALARDKRADLSTLPMAWGVLTSRKTDSTVREYFSALPGKNNSSNPARDERRTRRETGSVAERYVRLVSGARDLEGHRCRRGKKFAGIVCAGNGTPPPLPAGFVTSVPGMAKSDSANPHKIRPVTPGSRSGILRVLQQVGDEMFVSPAFHECIVVYGQVQAQLAFPSREFERIRISRLASTQKASSFCPWISATSQAPGVHRQMGRFPQADPIDVRAASWTKADVLAGDTDASTPTRVWVYTTWPAISVTSREKRLAESSLNLCRIKGESVIVGVSETLGKTSAELEQCEDRVAAAQADAAAKELQWLDRGAQLLHMQAEVAALRQQLEETRGARQENRSQKEDEIAEALHVTLNELEQVRARAEAAEWALAEEAERPGRQAEVADLQLQLGEVQGALKDVMERRDEVSETVRATREELERWQARATAAEQAVAMKQAHVSSWETKFAAADKALATKQAELLGCRAKNVELERQLAEAQAKLRQPQAIKRK